VSRPRILFCYRYGLLGGVSAQLLNRLPYLTGEFDVRVVYELDLGMVNRFPTGVATAARTVEDQRAAIQRARPDVTVVIDSPSFIEAWHAAGSAGKLVLEVHTTTANRMYLKDRDRLVGVSHIVTVSAYMQRLLGEFGLTTLAPVAVVPNCLDDRWRAPSSPPDLDARPAIWVGKLDGHKRWRTALDLLEWLADLPGAAVTPAVTPVVIGGLTAPDREVRAITTRLANSAALSRGHWWPRVEYDRMPALYTAVGSNGGVHVCTSMNESFGMAVAESLVRGCPVLAPAVGALPELLPDAALYAPGDWREAREKARRALVDRTFRDDLLATADHVRELTGPERVGRAYRAVVTDLLGGA
jgi:glycosyltransferase involved in cell wall biosynthesis